MHSPTHPGEIIQELYLAPLGITVVQASEALGVSRKYLSQIINGHMPVRPGMAARLAVAFGTEPDTWINLQAQHDLWVVSQQPKPKVKQLRSEDARKSPRPRAPRAR